MPMAVNATTHVVVENARQPRKHETMQKTPRGKPVNDIANTEVSSQKATQPNQQHLDG
jgi:hypothetical protein